MIGLALEGGGAKGAYQAGAYMALKKCGIKVDAVAGTSIGSLNGALIASHDEDKMVSLWTDATMSELLGIEDDKARDILSGNINWQTIKHSIKEVYKVLKNRGIDISNYRALVRNSVDEDKLRKSNIKFGLTTTAMENMEPLELYMEDIQVGKLHDYIVASSYLPIFKREKLIDDKYYLDGGFYNLSPVDMLIKLGCNTIYVINIKGIGFRKPIDKSSVKIIEIKPKNNLGSILVFDHISNKENMDRGYLDALKALGKIDGIDYYFQKKSDWYYKRLNHKVDEKLYKAASILLGSTTKKETVIKGLEYILRKFNKPDLEKYKHKYVIDLASGKNDENIIIKYVQKLSIW